MNRNHFLKSLFALPLAVKVFAKTKPREFKVHQVVLLDKVYYRIKMIDTAPWGSKMYIMFPLNVKHIEDAKEIMFPESKMQNAKIVGELYD